MRLASSDDRSVPRQGLWSKVVRAPPNCCELREGGEAIRQALGSARRARNTPGQPFGTGQHRSDWHSSATRAGEHAVAAPQAIPPLLGCAANSELSKSFSLSELVLCGGLTQLCY